MTFELVPPGPEPEGSGAPPELAGQRARSKAVGAHIPALGATSAADSSWVLGVDTVVEVDGVELGKPRDAAHARAMLQRLSGREHVVHTALALRSHPEQVLHERLESARVRCDAVSEAALTAFLATEAWRGKAGAYGIQDAECWFMSLVAGDRETVIGLPVLSLRELLVAATGQAP